MQDVFLSIIPLYSTTVDGNLETAKNELNNLGISHLISTKTDGLNMIAVQNGFVKKVRQNQNHLTYVHCVAHRLLHLSVLDVKHIKSINDINCVLKKLYKFKN